MKNKPIMKIAVVISFVAALTAIYTMTTTLKTAPIMLSSMEALTLDEDIPPITTYYEKPEKASCEYSASIDPQGYVSILGIKFHVGGSGTYTSTYTDAQIDCAHGGKYDCTPMTCSEFWAGVN